MAPCDNTTPQDHGKETCAITLPLTSKETMLRQWFVHDLTTLHTCGGY